MKNLLFLARLEFVCKTGCVPHYFQYIGITFLFSPQNLRLKFIIIIFLTSVSYCNQFDPFSNRKTPQRRTLQTNNKCSKQILTRVVSRNSCPDAFVTMFHPTYGYCCDTCVSLGRLWHFGRKNLASFSFELFSLVVIYSRSPLLLCCDLFSRDTPHWFQLWIERQPNQSHTWYVVHHSRLQSRTYHHSWHPSGT